MFVVLVAVEGLHFSVCVVESGIHAFLRFLAQIIFLRIDLSGHAVKFAKWAKCGFTLMIRHDDDRLADGVAVGIVIDLFVNEWMLLAIELVFVIVLIIGLWWSGVDVDIWWEKHARGRNEGVSRREIVIICWHSFIINFHNSIIHTSPSSCPFFSSTL